MECIICWGRCSPGKCSCSKAQFQHCKPPQLRSDIAKTIFLLAKLRRDCSVSYLLSTYWAIYCLYFVNCQLLRQSSAEDMKVYSSLSTWRLKDWNMNSVSLSILISHSLPHLVSKSVTSEHQNWVFSWISFMKKLLETWWSYWCKYSERSWRMHSSRSSRHKWRNVVIPHCCVGGLCNHRGFIASSSVWSFSSSKT